jgi:hypothetical protein
MQQTYIRIQLDMFSTALTAVSNAQQFNKDDPNYTVDLTPTPKWRHPADIVYKTTSIPADARFTDLEGAGEETISPTSPLARNGQPWFLFYRRDIFAAANLSKPETMDDVQWGWDSGLCRLLQSRSHLCWQLLHLPWHPWAYAAE